MKSLGHELELELEQHQREIQKNREAWQAKPELQAIYASFYRRILSWIDPRLPGTVLEIGSGMGNLKAHYPTAVCSDLFANDWLDLVCDGYELPFADGQLSHLILFDVFHHLETPMAFFEEARRALVPRGRVILFEPYISPLSFPVYGMMHHEPVAWRRSISCQSSPPVMRGYYAAQGNATRLFFKGFGRDQSFPGWNVLHREAFSSLHYFLSGGFSKPSLVPRGCQAAVNVLDRFLSKWPRQFGGRCLVVLERKDGKRPSKEWRG